MELKKGQSAPEFLLWGSDGREYTLNSFRGQCLILYFYPKDDTPGCTTEALAFSNLRGQFAASNSVVVGVSPDSIETHQNFIAKHKLDILLLADPAKTCIEAYGAWGEKKNYGKIYRGLIRSTLVIDAQGLVVKSYYNVKAKGHAERVLKEL